jgi:hypothetical protein
MEKKVSRRLLNVSPHFGLCRLGQKTLAAVFGKEGLNVAVIQQRSPPLRVRLLFLKLRRSCSKRIFDAVSQRGVCRFLAGLRQAV